MALGCANWEHVLMDHKHVNYSALVWLPAQCLDSWQAEEVNHRGRLNYVNTMSVLCEMHALTCVYIHCVSAPCSADIVGAVNARRARRLVLHKMNPNQFAVCLH